MTDVEKREEKERDEKFRLRLARLQAAATVYAGFLACTNYLDKREQDWEVQVAKEILKDLVD
jgi:hypothetical protein